MFRRIPVSLGAVLVLGCGTVAGCSGSGVPGDSSSDASRATTSASASESVSASGSPRPGKSHSAGPGNAGARDPLAPATIRPVTRDGKRPHPTVTAAPAPLRGVVRYGDGVTLHITGITQGRVTGKGPGVVDGPTTTFELSLQNNGRQPLDLNSVVVTLVYGSPGRVANPVYGAKSRDFAGTVELGRTSTALYTFMVPVSRRSRVTVHVDFDAVHTAAVFSGSAR